MTFLPFPKCLTLTPEHQGTATILHSKSQMAGTLHQIDLEPLPSPSGFNSLDQFSYHIFALAHFIAKSVMAEDGLFYILGQG